MLLARKSPILTKVYRLAPTPVQAPSKTAASASRARLRLELARLVSAQNRLLESVSRTSAFTLDAELFHDFGRVFADGGQARVHGAQDAGHQREVLGVAQRG
jgi:hypothetical protein